MRLLFLICLLGIVALIQAISIPSTHSLHEKRDTTAKTWIKREKVARSAILPMKIGLQQSNLHLAESYLMSVSDPTSDRYGQHWTTDEIKSAFAPSENAISAVTDWLVESGIERHRIAHSGSQGWLSCDVTAEEAEKLIFAEYWTYEHATSGVFARACDGYHLPEHIRQHVDFVTPGVKLLPAKKQMKRDARGGVVPVKSPERQGRPYSKGHKSENWNVTSKGLLANDLRASSSNASDSCASLLTPQCIKDFYGLPPPHTNYTPRTDNKLGIYESLASYLDQADLNTFFTLYETGIPNGTFPLVDEIDHASYGDGVLPAGGSPEANVDFQVAYPMIYPQGTKLFQDLEISYMDSFLDAIDGPFCYTTAYNTSGNNAVDASFAPNRQCGVWNATNVISASYSMAEFELPAAWQQRQCAEYLKLGLRGITVLFASGDYGVTNAAQYADDDQCLSSASNASSAGSIFNPSWPSNCPWITSVGATQLDAASPPPHTEIVAASSNPRWASAGGFSNVHPRPAYQDSAVSHYLSAHPPPYPSYTTALDATGHLGATGAGLFKSSGRAYPDISALGGVTAVVVGGSLRAEAGTSISAPLLGALITRINEARLNRGKRAVGFLNPVLYAYPQVLRDVVRGGSFGCGSAGFAAVEGWDPVSGLGAVEFGGLWMLWVEDLP